MDEFGGRVEIRESQVSKESHRFLTHKIVIQALGANAIWYHTPRSGHAIFFLFFLNFPVAF